MQVLGLEAGRHTTEPQPVLQLRSNMEASMIFGPRNLSHSEMVHRFATERNVTVKQLRGPNRKRPIVHHRQDCMAMLRNRTDLSLPEIGRIFNRDHSTVLNALKRVEERKLRERV